MSESAFHQQLISKMYNNVLRYVPQERHCFIDLDLPTFTKPKSLINGFIPDLYYCDSNIIIIGEAKTINDFNREHSFDQFSSYLQECEIYPGKSFLFLIVPWQLLASAKNYFKLCQKTKVYSKTTIIILDDLGQEHHL